MSVCSDAWIRRMAVENRMIEPFADRTNQKRENGLRVISYGLSSYGYDLRVSREFKVFTNVFNTVVDPKNFDAAVDWSILRPMSALCLPIPLLWREVSSISASLAMF